MKSLKKLKAREMKASKRINQFLTFIKYLQAKLVNYSKSRVVSMQKELDEQGIIRRKRLDFLALEAKRIDDELNEISQAYVRHTSNLNKLGGIENVN